MRIKMNGKRFALDNLSKEDKDEIVGRLSEKHGIDLSGGLGVKIDGKEVTAKNISEFEKKEQSNYDKFLDLLHIGDELARTLINKYGTYDNFMEKRTMEGLINLPGIGKKRAEDLMEV